MLHTYGDVGSKTLDKSNLLSSILPVKLKVLEKRLNTFCSTLVNGIFTYVGYFEDRGFIFSYEGIESEGSLIVLYDGARKVLTINEDLPKEVLNVLPMKALCSIFKDTFNFSKVNLYEGREPSITELENSSTTRFGSTFIPMYADFRLEVTKSELTDMYVGTSYLGVGISLDMLLEDLVKEGTFTVKNGIYTLNTGKAIFISIYDDDYDDEKGDIIGFWCPNYDTWVTFRIPEEDNPRDTLHKYTAYR